ncbi:MAG: protein translocase subunit SecD [Lachnospiraceae bacterium]|nr:protein translocase subunit SecD [Candidatus Merdinaster equi]
MKKSNGLIALIVTILATAGLGFLAFVGTGNGGSINNIKQGLDLAGGVSITYEVKGEADPSIEDMSDTVYKLQQRVEHYSTEAQVYQEGSNRISIEIPGEYDAEAVLAELGKPGSLYFIIEKDDEGNDNYAYGYSMDEAGNLVNADYYLNKDIETLMNEGSIILVGTDVKSANAGSQTDSLTGNSKYVVQLSLTPEGTEKFAQATKKAHENGWTIGIYYDGKFISVPRVDDEITSGDAIISGNFEYSDAEKLASNIRIGGLKLVLEELSSNVVGAQLGSKAISTSILAGLIGLACIILFMLIVYRIPGVAATISLVVYTVLTVLFLDFFKITLTLPGIAGIILSIGMAVDANVIIFSRIREELATGKTVKSSIDNGFKKALSAIIDGNVTTLIAAIVLMIMGSGSVKGFAQTLTLGIILSMFTALVICRLVLKSLFAIGCTSEKMYGVAKEKKSIKFISKKPVFFVISLAVIVSGLVFMFVKGLNLSLEFAGGTSFNVTFPQEYSLEEIDNTIKPAVAEVIGSNNIQASKVKDSSAVSIKTIGLTPEKTTEVIEMLQNQFGVTEGIEHQFISATISNEMSRDAIVAVIVAAILMMLYIWLRFRDLRFATSSVLALVHDVLVVLAFYVFSRIAIGSTFIACMLTIIGYSINATIVIFDRIRENMKIMGKKADLAEVANKSITQTLTRSIYTSLTTFVSVLFLYILGVPAIQDFALPLIVGIICGGYSSVCIAGALWYVMKKHIGGKKAAK